MTRIDEAIDCLRELGLPKAQQNERSGLTFLALAGIRPRDAWSCAGQSLLRTVDIMEFMRVEYGKDYKPNTREAIRRQALHQFEQARIVDRNPDEPKRPTNSGLTCYSLSDAVLPVISAYGTKDFSTLRDQFLNNLGSLREAYRRNRTLVEVPLKLPDGRIVRLSPGEHNELQVAVIEQMGARFAPGSTVLYVGDTASKHLIYDAQALETLGVPINLHDKLPDVGNRSRVGIGLFVN